jgi:hypothetical protein
MKWRKVDRDAVIAENSNQAIDYIFAGIKYFLIKYPIYTLVALAVFLGGVVYTGMDYYQKYQFHKSHTEQLKGK